MLWDRVRGVVTLTVSHATEHHHPWLATVGDPRTVGAAKCSII